MDLGESISLHCCVGDGPIAHLSDYSGLYFLAKRHKTVSKRKVFFAKHFRLLFYPFFPTDFNRLVFLVNRCTMLETDPVFLGELLEEMT